MSGTRTVLVAVLLVILIETVVYAVYASIPKPGIYLEGEVQVTYEDGTTMTLGSEDRQLFNLLNYWQKQQSVLSYQDKKVWQISSNIHLRFIVSPPSKSVASQYWTLFWLEIGGTYFWGGRSYSDWLGFWDTPLSTYPSTEGFNKWIAKAMNPEIDWFYIGSFVDPFYREGFSSVAVDMTTCISDPSDVTDALNGVPILGRLVDQLSAHLTAAEVRNGDRPLVVQWTMTGVDFYNRLKRSNFDGLSFHSGGFSVGLGEFARMWEEDSYSVKFKVGYFFRSRSITGEWQPWRADTVTIAAFNMKIAQGAWYVLSAQVEGGYDIS